MTTFAWFFREWAIVYYEAAHRHLCNTRPSHPDIPHITLKLIELKSRRIRCAQV